MIVIMPSASTSIPNPYINKFLLKNSFCILKNESSPSRDVTASLAILLRRRNSKVFVGCVAFSIIDHLYNKSGPGSSSRVSTPFGWQIYEVEHVPDKRLPNQNCGMLEQPQELVGIAGAMYRRLGRDGPEALKSDVTISVRPAVYLGITISLNIINANVPSSLT